jgi:hypothetical protein
LANISKHIIGGIEMLNEVSSTGMVLLDIQPVGPSFECDALTGLEFVRVHLKDQNQQVVFCGDLRHLLVGQDCAPVRSVKYVAGEVSLVAGLCGASFKRFRVECNREGREELEGRLVLVQRHIEDVGEHDIEWRYFDGTDTLVPVLRTNLTASGHAAIAPATSDLPRERFEQALAAWLRAHPEFAR